MGLKLLPAFSLLCPHLHRRPSHLASKRQLATCLPLILSNGSQSTRQVRSIMKDTNSSAAVTNAPAPETSTNAVPNVVPAKRDNTEMEPPFKKRDIELNDQILQVLLTTPEARLPTRGSEYAAGYDLYASEAISLPKGGRGVVKTGLKISIPFGCYGRVAPRSGLAVKKGIDVGAGVIDADYRGEVGVVLFNFGDDVFEISIGDRIAQLILEKIHNAPVVEVKTLDDTQRGEGGFGSTGVETK